MQTETKVSVHIRTTKVATQIYQCSQHTKMRLVLQTNKDDRHKRDTRAVLTRWCLPVLY